MKIFIPFNMGGIGGPYSFMSNFTSVMSRRGHIISNNIHQDFDVLLIIGDCPIYYLIYAKFKGKRIVQRIDGAYHRATAVGRWYRLYNFKMQLAHNYFAHHVVYQSVYSKICATKFLGKRGKEWTIIFNGIQVNSEKRRKEIMNKKDGARLVAFAKFRRRDQIEPFIRAVWLLGDEYGLDIYGYINPAIRNSLYKLARKRNINFMGEYVNEDLHKILKDYDIFLFSDQSSCPNSVIEAMASGLPVVAYNRGAISEIITPGVDGEIAEIKAKSDQFVDPYPFGEKEYEDFAGKIRVVATNREKYSQNAYNTVTKNFDREAMVSEYENILI